MNQVRYINPIIPINVQNASQIPSPKVYLTQTKMVNPFDNLNQQQNARKISSPHVNLMGRNNFYMTQNKNYENTGINISLMKKIPD